MKKKCVSFVIVITRNEEENATTNSQKSSIQVILLPRGHTISFIGLDWIGHWIGLDASVIKEK